MAANKRKRNGNGADDDAMQPPIAVQPRIVIAPVRVPTVEVFL